MRHKWIGRLIGIAALAGTFGTKEAAAQIAVTDMRPVEVPFDRIDSPTLSPNGQVVVFSATARDGRNHLFSMPASGGAPAQITSGAGSDWGARFSYDGGKIAFVSDRSGNLDIWVVPSAGGEARQITSDPADDVDPDWSPDGGRLVFASSRGGQVLLYQVTLADRQVYALSAGSGKDRRPAWSPDGRFIAFESTRDGRSHVWVLPPEGGEARRLSRTDVNEDSWPAWLPDSRHLVVRSGPPGTPGGLWILDLEQERGGMSTLAVPPAPGAEPGQGAPLPALSRDGTRMVFVGGGRAAIEVLKSTGGNPATIVTASGHLRHPSWSPEGRRLVVSGDSGGAWNLWVAGLSSGRLSRLTSDDAREENPSWSKVTGDILYSAEEQGGRSIFLLEPETKRAIRFGKSGEIPGHDSEPAWSPDARSVAFVSERQGSKDLYIAPVGAGEARRLAELPGNESHPTWSPDGKWIAFARDQGKGSEIWKIPVEGGAPVQVTHLKEGVTGDTQPNWSPAGSWIAFTRALASPAGASDVYIVSPDGGAPFPFRRGSGARISDPAWSPDGGHLAYCFSLPDQLYILELGEPAAPGSPAPGQRGTPEGMRRPSRPPAEPPAAPEPADPNQD